MCSIRCCGAGRYTKSPDCHSPNNNNRYLSNFSAAKKPSTYMLANSLRIFWSKRAYVIPNCGLALQFSGHFQIDVIYNYLNCDTNEYHSNSNLINSFNTMIAMVLRFVIYRIKAVFRLSTTVFETTTSRSLQKVSYLLKVKI